MEEYYKYPKDERYIIEYNGNSKCTDCIRCETGWNYDENLKIQNFHCIAIQEDIDPAIIDFCNLFKKST